MRYVINGTDLFFSCHKNIPRCAQLMLNWERKTQYIFHNISLDIENDSGPLKTLQFFGPKRQAETILSKLAAGGTFEQSAIVPGAKVFNHHGEVIFSNGRSFEEEKNPYAFSTQVTRFGFVKPTSAVVNSTKSEMSHAEVAKRLGFKSEADALEKGLVRFLVYKDGQSDMEIDAPLEKVAGAMKGFVQKSPDITGIVTVDAPRAKPYWSLYASSPKEFVQKVNAKLAGREVNPNHHTDPHGIAGSWGFIAPGGRLIDGKEPQYRSTTNTHDRLAKVEGLSSEAAAIKQGYIRYIFQHRNHGLSEVDASFGLPWDKRALLLKKYIDSLPEPVRYLNLDLLTRNGKSVDLSVTVVGDTNISTFLSAVGRGQDPQDVWEKVREAVRRENPAYYHDHNAKEWGWIKDDGTVIDGNTVEAPSRGGWMIHDDLARHFKGTADSWLDKGYVRFFVDRYGNGFYLVSGTSPDRTRTGLRNIAKHVRNSSFITGSVILDIAYDWPGAPHDGIISTEFQEPEAAVDGIRHIASGNWPSVEEDDDTWKEGGTVPLDYNPKQFGGKTYPFRLKQVGEDLYTAEFFDHTKVFVGTAAVNGSLVWLWHNPSTGEKGEIRDNMKSVLTDLSLMADQHTGRIGGTMKFVIYSRSGRVLGTVSAQTRAAARDRLRGRVRDLGVKTPQDVFLYPYLNAAEEVKHVADQGITV